MALVALIVALASACFAGLAWWTNYQKLRLDLYNRRFDIYSRTLDLYHALWDWEPTDLEKTSTSLRDSPGLRATQNAFIKASREARFLFVDESGIRQLLEQMSADAIWIIGYKRDCHKLRGHEMVLSGFDDFTNRSTRVHESIPSLEKKLEEYLDFHTIGRAGALWRYITRISEE